MMAMFLVSNQQDKVYTKMNLEAWAITTSNPETPLWPQTKHLYIYIWFYCKQQKNGGNSYQPILSARFFFHIGTKNPNFSFSKQVLGKKWSLLPPRNLLGKFFNYKIFTRNKSNINQYPLTKVKHPILEILSSTDFFHLRHQRAHKELREKLKKKKKNNKKK